MYKQNHKTVFVKGFRSSAHTPSPQTWNEVTRYVRTINRRGNCIFLSFSLLFPRSVQFARDSEEAALKRKKGERERVEKMLSTANWDKEREKESIVEYVSAVPE